jgi:hypothetical protein
VKNKKIYFISGFPRAGNTVLSSILNQNPKIKTTAHSILPDAVQRLDNLKKLYAYQNFPDEKSLDNLIEKTFDSYYSQWDAEYIIERGDWITPYNLNLLQRYFKNNEIKIVILVRDILDILGSFLNVCRRNAEFYVNKQYEVSDKSTVIYDHKEEKAEIIMSRENYVYSTLYSINDLIKQDTFNNYIFVEYNDLVSKPEDTLKKIYNFYDIEEFKHDFNNIKEFSANGIKYNDSVLGGTMHDVKTGKLERQKYVLSVNQRVVDKYSNLEMWRDVKDKTDNYNYIAKIQIKDAQSALDKFSKEEWDKYDYRQKTWNVHKETKTIPLLYSEDFSEDSPKREHYDKFESTLKAVEEKLIHKHSKGSIVRAILVNLPAGADIKAHQDHGVSLKNTFRYHIPLKTNPYVVFTVGGEGRNLKEGEIWEIKNTEKIHSVYNKGFYDRIHLIVDWKNEKL